MPEPISLPQDNQPPLDDWSSVTAELVDELPKAWTRGLLYVLIAFLSFFLPWSIFYQVEETGTARGRLEFKGNTVKQESDLSGAVTVVAIHAKEGDRVKAGQILLELDSKSLREERQQLQVKLDGQENRLSQLKIQKNELLLALSTQEQQNRAQALEKQTQVHQAQQNLASLQSAYALQKLEKLAPVEQAQQAIRDTQADYQLADSRWRDALAEVARYRQLFQEGGAAEVKVKEMQSQAKESLRIRQQDLANVQQAKLRLQEQQRRYQAFLQQATSDSQQAKLRLQEQQRGYQSLQEGGKIALSRVEQQLRDLEAQIASLQSEISQSQAQMQALDRQLQKYAIRAPFKGILFQFPVKQVGAVVQPGQLVTQIAPQEASLIFRAQIPSAESGFLREGLPVKLKFDAYPFQDYGVVGGYLRWIAPNSKVQSTPQGDLDTFELEISVDQTYIQAQNKRIILTPGQTATAEVVIRQRRLIDFVLDPFKKLENGEFKL